MMWYAPEKIILTSATASVNINLMGAYHIMYNSWKIHNCIICDICKDMTNCDIFLIFAQNIDRGYKLEPPKWGGSNAYLQSMF